MADMYLGLGIEVDKLGVDKSLDLIKSQYEKKKQEIEKDGINVSINKNKLLAEYAAAMKAIKSKSVSLDKQASVKTSKTLVDNNLSKDSLNTKGMKELNKSLLSLSKSFAGIEKQNKKYSDNLNKSVNKLVYTLGKASSKIGNMKTPKIPTAGLGNSLSKLSSSFSKVANGAVPKLLSKFTMLASAIGSVIGVAGLSSVNNVLDDTRRSANMAEAFGIKNTKDLFGTKSVLEFAGSDIEQMKQGTARINEMMATFDKANRDKVAKALDTGGVEAALKLFEESVNETSQMVTGSISVPGASGSVSFNGQVVGDSDRTSKLDNRYIEALLSLDKTIGSSFTKELMSGAKSNSEISFEVFKNMPSVYENVMSKYAKMGLKGDELLAKANLETDKLLDEMMPAIFGIDSDISVYLRAYMKDRDKFEKAYNIGASNAPSESNLKATEMFYEAKAEFKTKIDALIIELAPLALELLTAIKDPVLESIRYLVDELKNSDIGDSLADFIKLLPSMATSLIEIGSSLSKFVVDNKDTILEMLQWLYDNFDKVALSLFALNIGGKAVDLGADLVVLFGALGGVAAAVSGLVGGSGLLASLGAAIAGLTPVGAVVLGITGLSALFVTLGGDLEDVANGVGWLIDRLGDLLKFMIEPFKTVGSEVSKGFDKFKEFAGNTVDGAKQFFTGANGSQAFSSLGVSGIGSTNYLKPVGVGAGSNSVFNINVTGNKIDKSYGPDKLATEITNKLSAIGILKR